MTFWGHEPLAHIDADTAAGEVEQGAQLVDIGTPQEWFSGHLPHAKLVEPELIDNALKELSKDKPVVIGSRNPDLAAGAAAALHDHGFQVAILTGGPHAWASSGRPLVRADGK
jgi:rhodanese-related sulfurtransferase